MESKSVDYSKSALVVWDMQYGIAPTAFNYTEIVRNTTQLLSEFRNLKLPVFFSQHTGLPSSLGSRYAAYRAARRGVSQGSVWMSEGSKEWQIVKEVEPLPSDVVIKKYSPSFFIGTYFEFFLRNLGVETIVLVGVSTEVGIEGTARDAAYLGFVPVVVEGAVGSRDKSLHEHSLAVMRDLFEVRNAGDVTEEMNRQRPGIDTGEH